MVCCTSDWLVRSLWTAGLTSHQVKENLTSFEQFIEHNSTSWKYATLLTVDDHNPTHFWHSSKILLMCCFFNSLYGVWKCSETWSSVFNIWLTYVEGEYIKSFITTTCCSLTWVFSYFQSHDQLEGVPFIGIRCQPHVASQVRQICFYRENLIAVKNKFLIVLKHFLYVLTVHVYKLFYAQWNCDFSHTEHFTIVCSKKG